MSNKTIRNILIASGIITDIILAIYGANLGVSMAGYDSEFLYGLLGFICGALAGFDIIVICFAIGNSLYALERTADATEELLCEFRKSFSVELTELNDNKKQTSVPAVKNTSRTINKLSSIANGEQFVSDSWTCKKCGRVNLRADMTCKDCGEYK